ncbi:MAG TPA: sulfur reduction protein DsrS [Gammaproteobacteria bacterium]|nr:sulfur reduction protein DsrS [Gammaproteobacteria bacterium]
MELSSEDALRLNVLISSSVAIRVDEGKMLVYGRSERGQEAMITLNPNCRSDQYIRAVKELLSSMVLGSPGGYPVFLKRWTRMGQASDIRLHDLLKLGEPEAVVAVAGAQGLTDELAELAWWAMPNTENARCMLTRECVVNGKMGKVLADFLMEFLPFEEEPGHVIESVSLVLQEGLIDEEARIALWKRGKSKNVYRVGFLFRQPDKLPDPVVQRSDYPEHEQALTALAGRGNVMAASLLRVLSARGQTFIHAAEVILKKPSNQDVVVVFLETLVAYCRDVRLSEFEFREMDTLISAVDALQENEADGILQQSPEYQAVSQAIPELKAELAALMIIAHTGEPIVRSIFAITDAVGTVMRKKLEPVSKPLMQQFAVLRGMT